MALVIRNLLKINYIRIIVIMSIISLISVSCRPSEVDSPPRVMSETEDNIDPNEYYGDLSPETIRKIRKCDMDMDLMELCMRCAKVTKSGIVYPMCCGNEDNVKSWCREYIFYGTEVF